MRIASMLLCAAAVSLAASGCATDRERTARNNPPSFDELDKDNDGVLSRSEALGLPGLAAEFDKVDVDQDGKLSRFEYLKHAGRQDVRTLRQRAADLLNPDKPKPSSGR